MISLDSAQLWDLFRMETDHSNQQSGFHFTSKRGGNWLLFWRGLSRRFSRSTKRCPTKRQKAKCSCFDRSCCPLAVIDPNISAPRTKIDPKKATRQIRPKIGAPHTVHQNRAQKPHATHQKRPQKGTPCTEIGPKIGAPHTAHQNRAQKRRTAHQNPPQKRRTAHPKPSPKRRTSHQNPPERAEHAPGPRPHIRQVSGSIPPRSSPILIDLVARWLWSTPTSAHHAPKSIPKRQRTKKAHRAPKSAPRSALHTLCTKMEPKNGGPHTKNDPKKEHRAPKKAPRRALCTQTKSTTETTHRWQLVPRPPPDPWKIF